MNELFLTYYGVVTAKKNSKQIIFNRRSGRPMLISNRRAKKQETDMAWVFHEQANREGWSFDEKRINSVFYIEIKIWNKDRRRRDLDNQATAILDALTNAQVIPDDSVDYVPRLNVEYKGIDRANPRAEIKIKEIAWEV